jgi:hypothetical protein
MLALALTGLCLGAVIGERRAEDALRLSEEKFAWAFHAQPGGAVHLKLIRRPPARSE